MDTIGTMPIEDREKDVTKPIPGRVS